MSSYYNEIEPYVAQWLKNLISTGLIPDGDVDERDIREVRVSDLRGYRQCHFFAGIAGWPLALQLAGWPEDREVWTGSCPCQPLSCAGQRRGHADERHLWPSFHSLIAECRPATVFGEQVATTDGREWLSAVRSDLETVGYACGAADLPAYSVGAPHIRQRLYFVAHAEIARRAGTETGSEGGGVSVSERDGSVLGNAGSPRLPLREPQEVFRARRGSEGRATQQPSRPSCDGGVADAELYDGRSNKPEREEERRVSDLGVNPWSELEWLPCRDGKWRPTKPGLLPLAHGVSGRMVVRRSREQGGTTVQEEHWYSRVGAISAFGNAIVPQVAAEFIMASSIV